QPCAAADRLAMVRLAVANNSKFKVYDGELLREGPSYTSDTMRTLVKEHDDVQWVLLLGDDCIPGLPRWKDIEALVGLVELAIASRRTNPRTLDQLSDGIVKDAAQAGIIPTPVMDIDATMLRKRLRRRAFCDHLCPHKVLDYIHTNNLYLEV
ncbi:MAG: hypothetical protein KDK78_00035, partial [Chlamydiia bacterium]|nr:hypothetical protein [Chlamydiia bacterium]